MKYIFYLYSILVINSVAATRVTPTGAQKAKTSLISDQSAPEMRFPDINNWQGFQINFSNQPITIGLIPDKKFEAPALLIGFPAMGHYRGEGYNLKKRLALVQFDPVNCATHIPEQLQSALAQKLGVTIRELPKKLAQLDVRFNAQILGAVIEPQHDSPDNSYNIIYHFWGGLWHKNPAHIVQFYNENIDMGIFNPNGVVPKDLSLNSFKPLSVNWHAPEHMSPDNARLIIEKNRNFVSFWAAALSPDKKYLSITFFLIAQSPAAENFIAKALQQSHTIFELKTEIGHLISNSKHNLSKIDTEAVQNWIDTVFKIVDPKLFSEVFTPPSVKTKPACEPVASLNQALTAIASL